MSVATYRLTNFLLLAATLAMLILAGISGIKAGLLTFKGVHSTARITGALKEKYVARFRTPKADFTILLARPFFMTYNTGDPVKLVYLADDPLETATLDKPYEIWLLPAGAAGCAFMLISALLGRRRMPVKSQYAMSDAKMESLEPMVIMRLALAFLLVTAIGVNATLRPKVAPAEGPIDSAEAVRMLDEQPADAAASTPAATAAPAGALALTPENFAELLQSSAVPVFVAALSTDAPASQRFVPELKRVEAAWRGRLVVYHLDGASQPGLARQLGVFAYPTLLLLYRGRQLGRNDGGFLLPPPQVLKPGQLPPPAVDEAELWKWLAAAEQRAQAVPK
ncbi:MAG TPA: thioredoxin domain-containing protein [Patescibacteria group bacterium]|nr:thioredoxin domain-containing protein [Patescibacteria group bacterium]